MLVVLEGPTIIAETTGAMLGWALLGVVNAANVGGFAVYVVPVGNAEKGSKQN
jgi:hypothetical protein